MGMWNITGVKSLFSGLVDIQFPTCIMYIILCEDNLVIKHYVYNIIMCVYNNVSSPINNEKNTILWLSLIIYLLKIIYNYWMVL